MVKGKLGAHSVRKDALTYITCNCLSREYIIRRGHWRSKNQVVDLYIDNMNQLYPDILAGCNLCCPKGACTFKINRDTLSGSFIITKVVLYCYNLVDELAELTLGKVVLWSTFEELYHPNSDSPHISS